MSIEVEDLPSFAIFQESLGLIKLTSSEPGDYSIKITLKDTNDNTYAQTLKVEVKAIETPEPVEEEPQEETNEESEEKEEET